MDTYPGFHPEGPQGLIDSILHIEDCDVLLGIFWKRFGTPTTEAGSGTEHEFLRAYAAWKQHGCPQIMVYFNLRDPKLRSTAEHAQYGQVLQFQEHFPEEGLWWTYNGKAQFERLVRNHLTQFLRQRGHTAPAAPHARPGHDAPASVQQPDGLQDAYLTWLMDQVRAVPLTGVDPKSIREETRRDLDLAAVYTALMTQRTDMAEERTLRPDREARQLSALAVLNTEPHLALLGDPGSGKRTFLSFVALCMAGELCHYPDANLRVLTAPVPEDDDAWRRRREEEPQPQPWEHGAILPMRVVLREFVARGLPHMSQSATVRGDSLWRFIIAELPETLRPFEPSLRQQLLRTGGLLLLDGLDEVPEADQRRVQVKTTVEQFAVTFPKVRVLVTSRTYAYQRQDWKLRDFAEAVLAPFSRAQMHRFVDRWYAYVGQARRLSADDVQGRATLLKQAIARTPRLFELAPRPLRLTLMD